MLHAQFGLMVLELLSSKYFSQSSGMLSATAIAVESAQAAHYSRG
jgi:hypothetical protein